MIIRPMQPDEIDSVVVLFNYYREAARIDEDQYNEARVVQTIKTYTVNWNLFFNVAYDGQRPVGVVGGFVSEDPIEGTRGANIQFCYLVDGHASRENYQQLINKFEEWAREVKATSIKCLDIGYKPDRLKYIYETLGYSSLPLVIMGKEIE